MFNASTLTALMEDNRNAQRAVTYLEGENEERVVAYGELYERALGILFHLQKLGAKRGDKIILFLGNNEQFLDAFWAAVLGGIIPVPVALGISDEHRRKLLRIARKLGQPLIYTDKRSLERIGAFANQSGADDATTFAALQQRAFVVDNLNDISRAGEIYRAQPGDTAFIQFSSGSTSEPKGVVLTHANILANARGAIEAAKFTPDDVSLSWMPLTHDMGLIGFHLFMFASRIQCNLMPTELFIRRPLLWLQLATKKRATITCSPNFGYKHYLKVLGDRSIEGLDLSSVRLIFNGAEPISAELCDEFLTRMAPAKLKREAMFTVYGLAEASLAMTFPPVGRRFVAHSFKRESLAVGSKVVPTAKAEKDAIELISEGKPIPYSKLRIAKDDDSPMPDEHVGHVYIGGENVTKGYFENPEANAASVTSDGWVRTGDLGFIHQGELYISGRAKEIIFVNGQNYYPHDLESIAQRADGMELGKVVAAGVQRKGETTEQLVVFVLHRSDMKDFLPLANQVSRLINENTGVEVGEVVPVKRIPKTTSGKIQRHLLEESYVQGEFDAELAELATLRAAQRGPTVGSRTAIEDQLKTIVDAALEGKRVDLHDNLFEVGASSLKLIEIHENIDREYPGLVDLTELFDFPTIAELALHLEGKLAARA